MPTSKTWRIVFAVMVCGITFICLAFIGFLHFDPLCSEETISEKPSPDKRYVAVLMSRNCGATTPYVAHINLRQTGSKFRSDFFDGAVKAGEVFASSKYDDTRFCWSGPHRLSIGYPDMSSRAWHDVTIDSDFRNSECQ